MTRRGRSGGAWAQAGWVALGIGLGAALGAHAQVTPASVESRWLTQRERADPLEPMSLEPGRDAMPAPAPLVPPVVPVPVPGGVDSTVSRPSDLGATTGRDSVRDAERVVVVTCRQVLVDDPRLASRLSQLLRAGASFEDATRALGRTDLVPRQREYALDELAPEIRTEVERLPEGGWSDVRAWRGRSALFQVVSREERTRGSIPRLGAGLDASEVDRLAQRSAAAQRAQATTQEAVTGDYIPAKVTEQAVPEYPASLTESGNVVVEVDVGVTDTPTATRVVTSSNRLFDAAAVAAAQHSKYQSAKRRGVPEQATITLTFNFVAPQSNAGEQRRD